MATLRDLRYRDSQKIVDAKGNEVDLSNLDRNFSAMYDAETGEPVTNYKLQAYMDNPQLADIERDLALVKAGPGQYTAPGETEKVIPERTYERTGEYEDTRIESKVNPEYEREQGKRAKTAADAAAASQRLQGYATESAISPFQPIQQPQQLRFDGTYDDRRRFKKMIIETKFGGIDPLTIDPIAQVEAQPPSFYQQQYERRFAASYGQMPYWWDLDDKQRQAFIKEQKAIEVKKAQELQSMMALQMKDYLGDYEAQATIHEHEEQRKRETQKTAIKQYREAEEKRQKQRDADRKAIAELQGKLLEAYEKKQRAQYYPDQEAALSQEIETLQTTISELQKRVKQQRDEPLQPQGPEIKVRPGSRTRGKPTAEILKEYAGLSGLTRLQQMGVPMQDPRYLEAWRRAKQMLEDAGFDTDPVPEGQASQAKQPAQKPAAEKKMPDLYQ